jgi:hypothetical protein
VDAAVDEAFEFGAQAFGVLRGGAGPSATQMTFARNGLAVAANTARICW